MNAPPLITCIVAVYNGQPYLAEALDSILAQTYRPLELVVVNDGSTDETARVIEGYGDTVRAVWQPNGGPAAARNHGLSLAGGEFIAFLDADDRWHPEKLSRQMACFDARTDLEMSVTLVQNFWAPELREEEAQFRDHKLSKPAAGYSTVAMLAKKAVFDTVGQFTESWQHVHDTEWFIRAADAGIVSELLSDVLVFRRLHRHNRSRLGAAASRDEYLQLVQGRVARAGRSSGGQRIP